MKPIFIKGLGVVNADDHKEQIEKSRKKALVEKKEREDLISGKKPKKKKSKAKKVEEVKEVESKEEASVEPLNLETIDLGE